MEAVLQHELFEPGVIPTKEVDESKLSRQEKLQRRLQWFRDMLEVKGFLVPVPLVAEILGVSHQRVCQLAEQGHLEVVKMRNASYISENSLVAYSKLSLKGGRPPKVKTVSDALKVAKDLPNKM